MKKTIVCLKDSPKPIDSPVAVLTSRPNILAFLRHLLRDTPKFTRIRKPSFGKLFDLPTRQCPVSCKLIHSLLTRQLVCKIEHTLWTVFGSGLLRFSLEEFRTITSLNCGAFPDGYQSSDHSQKGTHNHKSANKDPYWLELIGENKNITIADLADQLENEPNMPSWRRLRLALIIIVDGVLIASQQVHRPTLRLNLSPNNGSSYRNIQTVPVCIFNYCSNIQD
ncbi:hypothetical protein N665_0042s0008 [Sinapis alba]|nr:hypothetical protein N665_0042s0008 [Sinapis alba]